MKYGRKIIRTGAAVLLGLLLLWLTLASLRLYFAASATQRLIDQVEPYQQPGKGTKKLLVLGDSFAYGTGASSPTASMVGQIGAAYPDLKIINKAANGTKAADLAARVDREIGGRYDVILISVGTNDVIHPEVDVDTSGAALEQVLAAAAKSADHVVLVTTPDFDRVSLYIWPLNEYFGVRSDRLNDLASKAAKQHANIIYIDVNKVAPEGPENNLLVSEDRLHPNDLGMYYWHLRVKLVLKQFI